MFLLERILLAIALYGVSGCDSALIYLSVEKDRLAGVFGKVFMFGTVGMYVASLCFSLFFRNDFRGAVFFISVAYFLAFF